MNDVNTTEPVSNGVVPLSRIYPISHLLPLKRTLPLLMLFLIAVGSFFALLFNGGEISLDNNFSISQGFSIVVICVLFLFVLGKYCWEQIYRACYTYGIEANHLSMSKGVILKQRGQFPLSRITDVYLDRTLGDLFLAYTISTYPLRPSILRDLLESMV